MSGPADAASRRAHELAVFRRAIRLGHLLLEGRHRLAAALAGEPPSSFRAVFASAIPAEAARGAELTALGPRGRVIHELRDLGRSPFAVDHAALAHVVCALGLGQATFEALLRAEFGGAGDAEAERVLAFYAEEWRAAEESWPARSDAPGGDVPGEA